MDYSGYNKKTGLALFIMILIIGLAVALLVLTHQHDYVVDEQIDATCTTDGYWSGKCICGKTQSEVVPAKGHAINVVHGYDATCTEPGLKTYEECTVCDYTTFTNSCVIAAKGHVCANPEKVVTKKVTCTEDGAYQIVKVCDVCHVEYSREDRVEKHKGHEYLEVDAKAATCIPGHYAYHICKVCYYVPDYVEIPAAYDHISSVYPIVYNPSVVDPTCTESGSYMMAVCCTNDDCDYLFGELTGPYTIDALGHYWISMPSDSPSCTSDGHTAYQLCGRCYKSEGYQILPALGHNMLPVAEKPATCTNNGHTAYSACSRCSHTVGKKTLYAFGHTPGEIKIENLVEPTCVEWGSYDRVIRCVTCNVILDSEHWDVEPVVHNELAIIEAKDPTCTEPGWVEYEGCAKCGYVENFEDYQIPATGHSYVYHEGKAPECFEAGYHAYETCSVCDYTTFSEIPALGGHNYGADGHCQNSPCTAYVSINLAYASNGSGWTVIGIGTCTDTAIVIPEVYMGAPVTAIGDEAFKGNENITSVVIPDSVNTIGEHAFARCKNLAEVTIGNGVYSIGQYAFFTCKKLTKVTIGSGLAYVGESAFRESAVSQVLYLGTPDHWAGIAFGLLNDQLINANRQYI